MSRTKALLFLCSALIAVTPALAVTTPKLGKWGVDLTSIDPAVKPGDNFFLHVNGGWLKTAQIPADRSSTGSFQDLQILSEERLKTIVNELDAKPEGQLSANEKKLRDAYDTFVDTASIEAKGLAPVQQDLAYLAGLKTLADVAHAMGSIKLATQSIYGIGISVDDKNPNNYSVNLNQSGLGMPDRDYYTSAEPTIVKTREAYRKYLADMMTLAGLPNAQARADKVLAVETEIAKVQW
ncbi:MAG: peptidase, partial [Alphaproteobacteria bacterium]|nr:peptidase [Alphaproteobacteria bacterium]